MLVTQETGRKLRVELVKFADLSKKNELDPSNMKTFKLDYRQEIKQKREENEKLREELQKLQEIEAKQEVLNKNYNKISINYNKLQ